MVKWPKPCPNKTNLGGEVAKAMLSQDNALHSKLQVCWVGAQAVVAKQELHIIPWRLPVVHRLVGDVLQQVQTRLRHLTARSATPVRACVDAHADQLETSERVP